MSRPVSRSQLKMKPEPEPKAPETECKDIVSVSMPQPQPSKSNSTSSSSSSVKSGSRHSSNSSSLPAPVKDARIRKMKREVKMGTDDTEETELAPAGKKKKTNYDDKQGLNPDLNYFEMLPPEIWEIVFKEVRDPLDFQALINSSPTWRKLLENERTKFLFPLVFPILMKNKLIDYKEKFEAYRTVCKTWDRGIQDYVQRYYRNAFLSSMKMSGEMEVVNEKFENEDPRTNDNFEYIEEIERHLSARHYVFPTSEKIDKFLEKFDFEYQQFARNPILARCVVISDFHLYTPERLRRMDESIGLYRPFQDYLGAGFLQSSQSLLRSFGEHIHYLTLELGYIYSSNVIDFQRNVYNWLEHVPNLKGLILKYKADQAPSQSVQERDKMKEAICPTLAHLQFLEVYNVPGIIFDGIVTKATSLRKVSIQLMKQSDASYRDYFNLDPTQGMGPQMPLTMLNMNIRSRDDLVNLESNLENGISTKIEILSIRLIGFYEEMKMTNSWVWWNYRERPFEFGYRAGWNNRIVRQIYHHETKDVFCVPDKDHVASGSAEEWPEWSRLFRVVELLGAESLLKLSIRLPAVQKGGSKRVLAECPDLRLNLSNLKTIVIHIPYTTSIDFLLGVKHTLEEATLIFPHPLGDMPYKDRLKEQIRFNGYFHIMMKSNIWTEMPKLKKLTIRVAPKRKPADTNLKEFNYERPS